MKKVLNKLYDNYGYFVTFGEFLNKLKQLVIPDLSGQGIVGIDNDEDSNICAVFPNIISLDPRICYIRPFFTESTLGPFDVDKTHTNPTFVRGTHVAKGHYCKQFGFTKTVEGKDQACTYGKIMNIYLNYEFIVKSLEDARDKSGDITIFKFLQK